MIDKLLADLQKDVGERAFLAAEAPPVKVISTGITSLDVATGVGGWPRGTLVEIYGRESVGKTALALYTIAEAHKAGGTAGFINLESGITKEGWLKWVESITPDYFDPERLIMVNADAGSESIRIFSKMIASGGLDVIVYDSIGAMSTDKELQIGESKQAYGQAAQVTQMIKQASKYAYEKECVPILLNQVRDATAGQYVIEKAGGGHAKDHFATLRVHLKQSSKDKVEEVIDGEKIQTMFRVNAKIVKNKVGAPRRVAGWNYWNYVSPSGVLGIDVMRDTVDTAMRMGVITRAGAYYRHDSFPDGQMMGGQNVVDFLRDDPDTMEEIRRELVMKAYAEHQKEENKEMLVDAI